MLVYTTLFTLAGKDPKENKYIDMFYMWFAYLKKYSGLGPNDCVGLIVDEDTLEYMNSEGNQTFSYLSEGVPFWIELSIMPRPANLSEGFAQRYNNDHFDTFTKHEPNLHTDIDCLCIRNIDALFKQVESNENTFYIMAEPGVVYDFLYGGHLLEKGIVSDTFPGISAGWYAWKHSEGQREMFNSVLKGCLGNAETPFYTVDQPFYIYEIIMRMVNKKQSDFNICFLGQSIVAFNPFISDKSLKDAYFANFAGEPGLGNTHFNKMFQFMLADFSTSHGSMYTPRLINSWTSTKKSTNVSLVFDTRNEMIQHYCNSIKEPKVLEIGIFKGEFFDYIINSCKISSIDGVDLFEGVCNSGNVDGNNSIEYNLDKSYSELSEKYKNMPNIRLIKSDSSKYLSTVEDTYYDIIYIDGDHSYEGVKKDLLNSFHKVKSGGYLMGHDYEMNLEKGLHLYNFGVKKAVDEFCREYNQKIIAKAMDGCVSYCIQITPQAAQPQPQAPLAPGPQGQPKRQQEEEHGPPEAASAAPQEEGDSRSSPPSP
jgi:hypothetical protein